MYYINIKNIYYSLDSSGATWFESSSPFSDYTNRGYFYKDYMKDYKLCLWFSPDPTDPIHKFTNGIPAHVILKTNLNFRLMFLRYTTFFMYSIN